MIITHKPHGKQPSFSGGPQFKIGISRVGGFYVLSVAELSAGVEVKFEVFDSDSRSIHSDSRTSNDGSVSLTWGAKLDAGDYKLVITASKNGRQVASGTMPFSVE